MGCFEEKIAGNLTGFVAASKLGEVVEGVDKKREALKRRIPSTFLNTSKLRSGMLESLQDGLNSA